MPKSPEILQTTISAGSDSAISTEVHSVRVTGGLAIDASPTDLASLSANSVGSMDSTAGNDMKLAKLNELFAAIDRREIGKVRELLAADPTLAHTKRRGEYSYPRDVELDALKFLGAFIGSMNALQYAILLSREEIALEILETIFSEYIDTTFGGKNTALHLAVFMGESEIVSALLTRGADWEQENSMHFTPLDLVNDEEIRQILASAAPAPA